MPTLSSYSSSLTVVAMLTLAAGCSDDSNAETPSQHDDAGGDAGLEAAADSGAAGADAGVEAGDSASDAPLSSNRALVFEIDPIVTPDPIDVDLDWIGQGDGNPDECRGR